jgi:hypothetical protein
MANKACIFLLLYLENFELQAVKEQVFIKTEKSIINI